MSDASMDATAADRQRRKRLRDKEDGWASVRLRVPAHRVDELKAFAESLGEPAPKRIPGEQELPLKFVDT